MQDILLSFGPQNALEQALVLAVQRPDERLHFYQALLEEPLFALTDPQPESGLKAIEEGQQVFLRCFEEGLVPVFSSVERIGENGQLQGPQAFIQLKGRELLQLLPAQASMVLNPFSEVGKMFAPDELHGLRTGALLSPQAAAERTAQALEPQVRLAAPAQPLPQVEQALRELFAQHAHILEAYLVQVFDPHPQLHYLLALHMEGDPEQDIFETAGPLVEQLLDEQQVVDFARLSPGDSLAQFLSDQVGAFYRRG